jgi:hypothetical protein
MKKPHIFKLRGMWWVRADDYGLKPMACGPLRYAMAAAKAFQP